MIVIALVLVSLLGLWVRHRVHVKNTRAGLLSERPVFSVEPPTRRMGNRSRESL